LDKGLNEIVTFLLLVNLRLISLRRNFHLLIVQAGNTAEGGKVMIRKWKVYLPVILFVVCLFMAGCSGNDASSPEEPAQTAPEDSLGVDVDDADILFDFYSTPSDWPRVVPSVMNDFRVTVYERTDSSMYAAGFGDVEISRVNNFYMNARKETGTSFNWEFDLTKDSVTEGSEQVFYYIDDEGKTLTIRFKEADTDRIIFELDFKE
jgi:hypothetical protein